MYVCMYVRRERFARYPPQMNFRVVDERQKLSTRLDHPTTPIIVYMLGGRLNDVSFVQILAFIRIICAYTEKREAQTSYRKTTFQLLLNYTKYTKNQHNNCSSDERNNPSSNPDGTCLRGLYVCMSGILPHNHIYKNSII